MTPDVDPDKSSWVVESAPWISAVILSMVGGAVHYLDKVNRRNLPFRLVNFVIEIFISAFTGIVSFILCDAANLGWHTTAAICAISGHMGARAWFLAERALVEPLLRRYGYGEDSEAGIGRQEKRTDYEAR